LPEEDSDQRMLKLIPAFLTAGVAVQKSRYTEEKSYIP